MEDWIAIARVIRARGNKGEVAAISLSSHPERFERLREVVLFGPAGPLFGGRPVGIEEVWEHKGRLIFKFQGVDSISDAERLRGAELRVPPGERAPLEKGEFYFSDLAGCQMVEPGGEAIGTVSGWQDLGGQALLEVTPAGGGEAILVPFVAAICVSIEPEKRRIVAQLPDGLKDLNRP